MIFLIDDKSERQSKFGWDNLALNDFKDVLTAIYNLEQITGINNIISENDIILFHESFFDNSLNKQEKDVIDIRQDLINYATKKGILVVFFGGSIGSRSINGNIAHMPVDKLYSNLLEFCKKYRNERDSIIINNIVFGKEYLIEEELILKHKIWDLLYEQDPESQIKWTAKLNKEVEDLEKVKNIKVLKEAVTVDYLKFQLNKITYE